MFTSTSFPSLNVLLVHLHRYDITSGLSAYAGLASSSSLLSEEQFLCPICLDEFTKPVSTPCGHNFCRTCITSYWNDTPACQCPVCKEVFELRPDLKVNTFISGLMSHFKSLQVADAQIGSSEQQQASGGGGMLCDVCTGTRREAVKSCVECLTSYCGEHLEPHHRTAGLRRHTLVGPSVSLEDEVCKEHARRLTLFCRDDEALLCDVCAYSRHLNHDVVPVQQASDKMRARLGEGEARAEQMIQERLQRVRAAKMSVEQSRTEMEKAMAGGVRELSAMVSEIQTIQTELERLMEEKQRAMEEKQRAEEERADRFVSGVEQEISELRVTAATLKQLNEAEDPLSVLRSFPRRPLLPRMADSSAFSCTDNTEMVQVLKSVTRLTSRMQKSLSEMNVEIKRFSDAAALRHAQLFEEDVTLDVDTAHPDLIVSDDRKQVRCSQDWNQWRSQTLNPNMFTKLLAVLGDRGFQSQKFYFEVFVGEKISWYLGVATASIQRNITFSEGFCPGLWAIRFIVDKFVTLTSPPVTVHWEKIKRVGVFVDYNGGQISFYDVETDTLIYAFTECLFTEALFPYFNTSRYPHGANLHPMVIVPAGREWR